MRRKWLLVGGATLIVGASAGVWAARDTYASARIGAAYVAKQTCSCLFVARRSMASCRTDYDANDIAPLAFDADDDGVTVSALGGLVSAEAEFTDGFGCHPAN
jgi:hypothetical protein